jgi:cysteine desulfurase/selenocysteine lyase
MGSERKDSAMSEMQGQLFSSELSKEIKDRFYYTDADPDAGQRLFFENSGGSLRLKAAVEAQAKYQAFPDCPERGHPRALKLKEVQNKGIEDIMKVIFGAKSGELLTELTASQVMYQIVGAILENVPGDNAVTSIMEHPSSYDAVAYYCKKTGKQMKVAQADPKTGRIEVEEIQKLVTPKTALLSIMWASNISGAIMDMEGIVGAARKINPDIYIISDSVQHIPHAAVDVEALHLDGANFGGYKFFAPRGMGFGYVSDRVARLPHRKLLSRPENVWELGSPAPANFAAMSAVVDYVCWIGGGQNTGSRRAQYVEGMKRIHSHEQALLSLMLDGTGSVQGLREMPNIVVYADERDLSRRDLIVAVGMKGMPAAQMAEEYRKRGIIVFERLNTSPYSKRAVEAIGTPGVVRVSPLHCHTKEDIEKFLEISKDISSLA